MLDQVRPEGGTPVMC